MIKEIEGLKKYNVCRVPVNEEERTNNAKIEAYNQALIDAIQIVKNCYTPDVSGSCLDYLAKPSNIDLKKVDFIHEQIMGLIHGSDIHEDIIESLLKPFEYLLKQNGVNLDETDY